MAKPKFTLTSDISGTVHSAIYGEVEYKFSKGDVTPKNEQEEAALNELVGAGLAKKAEVKE